MSSSTPPYTRVLNKARWDAVNRTVLVDNVVDSRVLVEAESQRRSGAYHESLATLATDPAAGRNSTALITRALALLGLDDVDGALAALDDAENAVLFSLATVLLNRSAAHGVAGRFDEQERWARAALDVDAACGVGWVNLLAARREQGDTVPALVAEMDIRWPEWPDDEHLRSQVEHDITLRHVREHEQYALLFVHRYSGRNTR